MILLLRVNVFSIALLVTISFLGLGCKEYNYLRSDAEVIQSDFLKRFPVGSTMDEIEKSLQAEGMTLKVSKNTGFSRWEKEDFVEIGKRSIRVELGEYRSSLLTITSVTAFWAFDEQNKLIEVWVWKTIDGP